MQINIKSYLFQSVKNISIDYIRKNQKYSFQKIEEDSYISEEDINEEYIQVQYKKLHHKLRTLPPNEYKVLMAIIVEDKKYKQVADEMNISVNTVKTHYSRAMKSLRKEKINLSDIYMFL